MSFYDLNVRDDVIGEVYVIIIITLSKREFLIFLKLLFLGK